MIEKVVDNKKDYVWKPYQREDIHKVDNILRKYVTKDLFRPCDQKKYEFWKKHPIYALRHLDKISKQYGFSRMANSQGTPGSIGIKILLRLKGMNKMEQLNKETKLKHDDIHKKTEKRNVVPLANNFIEEIKKRSEALAQEDAAKKALVAEAKKKGWEGLTLEEIDLDLGSTYRKLAKQMEKIEEFKESDLKVISMMNQIKKDKIDIKKFEMNMALKYAEMEERTAARKAMNHETLNMTKGTLE